MNTQFNTHLILSNIVKAQCSVDVDLENGVLKSDKNDFDIIGTGMGEGKQKNICRTDSRGE